MERIFAAGRWFALLAALSGIVLTYRRLLPANATVVALTFLLLILIVAARWKLRHAVVLSIAATACYNFFFLPPIGSFAVDDLQNWLALVVFLAVSVIGSRLSQRARSEAQDARSRQREVELLLALSRELLQPENMAQLRDSLPALTSRTSGATDVQFYLLAGDRLYGSVSVPATQPGLQELRRLASQLREPMRTAAGEITIPLHSGVRPRGLVLLRGIMLSQDTCRAIGSLISIALERTQALEELARGEAEKQSERLRTLILDSITHELRTPLTSIKGAASTLLTSRGIDEDDRRDLLEVIDEESDRLNRLVAQAVEMAQLDAQEVKMTIAPVSLHDLAARALTACASVTAQHSLQVEVPPNLRVLADTEMIVKVLCNLLENAAKYSPAGTAIVLSSEQQGCVVLTSVSDQGIGIDPEEQELIFDRLYRVRVHAGGPSGTGMGLAICRSILRSHNGAIAVASRLGKGSSFTFSLPNADEITGLGE